MLDNGWKAWFNPRNTFLYVVLILLIAATFFRFVNLDQKVYTADEVRGIARMVGYTCNVTCDQLTMEAFSGQIITPADLQKYQHVSAEKTVGDTIQALAGNAEHPPLYYLLSRFWIQFFNNPVGARLFTALTSLLIFPAVYWLTQELFESPLIGLSTVALVAVSPYYLMLAQEARQYSLWTLAIVLAGATLLRSLKHPTWKNWVMYALAIALGIYGHLFFVLVVVSYGVYVFAVEGFKLTKVGLSYLVASIAGLATLLPWVLVLINNHADPEKTTSWVASFKTSFPNRLEAWLHNLTTLFVELQVNPDFRNPLLYLCLGLVVYAVYFLYKNTTPRIWLFVVLLLALPALAYVVPDLVSGGRRSLTTRYFVPSFLAIELAISYLLVTQTSRIGSRWWQQPAWRFLLGIVLTLGFLSSAASAQARDWWKGSASTNIPVAAIVNRVDKPLLISDPSHTFALSLSYLLNDRVNFQLFHSSNFDQLKSKIVDQATMANYSNVYIYLPSRKLKEEIETNRGLKLKPLVKEDGRQWLYEVEGLAK